MTLDRSIILHIGTEKTGTTTIQRFLSDNRKRFAAAGVMVPLSLGGTNHRLLASIANEDDYIDEFALQMKLLDPQARAEAKERWWNSFVQELNASAATKVIVSSEHLQSRLRSDNELVRLKARLDQVFGHIRILLYIREPLETAMSMYSTAVKGGSTAAGIPGPDNEYFQNVVNHARTIKRWAAVFGQDNIVVRLFSAAEFVNGDLIDDLAAACDLPPIDGIRSMRANESLSDFGLRVMRQVNAKVPPFNADLSVNPTRIGIDAFFERHFTAGRRYAPDANMIRLYDKAFADANEWVRSSFFPGRERLFDLTTTEPFKMSDDEVLAAENTARALTEIWLQMHRSDTK